VTATAAETVTTAAKQLYSNKCIDSNSSFNVDNSHKTASQQLVQRQQQ
jgi:hypothetical protein